MRPPTLCSASQTPAAMTFSQVREKAAVKSFKVNQLLGDAIVPLKEYLREIKSRQGVEIEISKDTVYCMDNEAFRFLWAVHRGIPFDKEAHEKFSKSWKKSAETTRR